jgi:hypothetical protein
MIRGHVARVVFCVAGPTQPGGNRQLRLADGERSRFTHLHRRSARSFTRSATSRGSAAPWRFPPVPAASSRNGAQAGDNAVAVADVAARSSRREARRQRQPAGSAVSDYRRKCGFSLGVINAPQRSLIRHHQFLLHFVPIAAPLGYDTWVEADHRPPTPPVDFLAGIRQQVVFVDAFKWE